MRIHNKERIKAFFLRKKSVLSISSGVDADPGPAFYLNADPDSDPGQT
jgi:hypothetical protein